MIQHHQAKLNFPYITSHMKGAFSGFTEAANNKHNGTGALWAKLRRGKLHHTIRTFSDTPVFRDRKQAWLIVSHLCTNTRIRFDTIRQLLQSATPTSTIYALYKLSNNLPRRDRRQARKALHTVFRKRRLRTPPTSKPNYVQPLMRPSFNNDLRQFLRNRVTEARHTIPPLHLPSTKLVCKKHPPLQQILHNWHQAHTTWQPNQGATCTCAQLPSTVSPDHIYNNHIAIQLAELKPQHSFLAYLGKSNILPKRSQLVAQLTRSIRSCHRHYHIPFNSAATKQFANQQLSQHRGHDRKHLKDLNIQTIKHVQQQLPSGIIHCEDHFLIGSCGTVLHCTIRLFRPHFWTPMLSARPPWIHLKHIPLFDHSSFDAQLFHGWRHLD